MAPKKVLDPGHMTSVAGSRQAVLGEIGAAPDLTLVKGIGNVGDELILAGTRELLHGHVYREIDLDDLPRASGGTALLTGGGAWCRTHNDFMPEALAVAEKIAGYSLPVVMMIKESINRAYETSLAEGVLFERRVFQSQFALEDQKEGMAAFLEKRKPAFKNR